MCPGCIHKNDSGLLFLQIGRVLISHPRVILLLTLQVKSSKWLLKWWYGYKYQCDVGDLQGTSLQTAERSFYFHESLFFFRREKICPCCLIKTNLCNFATYLKEQMRQANASLVLIFGIFLMFRLCIDVKFIVH